MIECLPDQTQTISLLRPSSLPPSPPHHRSASIWSRAIPRQCVASKIETHSRRSTIKVRVSPTQQFESPVDIFLGSFKQVRQMLRSTSPKFSILQTGSRARGLKLSDDCGKSGINRGMYSNSKYPLSKIIISRYCTSMYLIIHECLHKESIGNATIFSSNVQHMLFNTIKR